MQRSVPLFETDQACKLLAVFDAKGFFLSPEANRLYNERIEIDARTAVLKNLPHMYTARTVSGNHYYFGISNQRGGRWKRTHAYHLGTLAYELLGTTRYDDQDHGLWLDSWFDRASFEERADRYIIRMKEAVIISFFVPDVTLTRSDLLAAESMLIREAKKRSVHVLNKIS